MPLVQPASSRRRPWLVFVAVFVLPPLLLDAFALLQPWTNPANLFRDPLFVAEMKFNQAERLARPGAVPCCGFWYGALSNVGVLVWAAAAGALASAWLGLITCTDAANRRRRFLLVATMLTALLAVDDLFQIHEQERLLAGLKGEVFLYPLFAILAATYVVYRDIVRTPYVTALLAAGLCFAVSLGADQVLPQGSTTAVVEDAVKLVGIFLWAGYHLLFAVEALAGRPLFFLEPTNSARS